MPTDAYSFDNCIVNDTNRLAFEAALEVARNPGLSYNPLFIWGKPGLGKSHLLKAMGQHIRNTSDKKVMYLDAENFYQQWQLNAKTKQIPAWRKKHMMLDVLLIDNIEFLHNKKHALAELCSILNSFINDDKQVVLVCNRPAGKYKNLFSQLKLKKRNKILLVNVSTV